MTVNFTITAVGLCIGWTLFAALANAGVSIARALAGRDSWVLYFVIAAILAWIGIEAL